MGMSKKDFHALLSNNPNTRPKTYIDHSGDGWTVCAYVHIMCLFSKFPSLIGMSKARCRGTMPSNSIVLDTIKAGGHGYIASSPEHIKEETERRLKKYEKWLNEYIKGADNGKV